MNLLTNLLILCSFLHNGFSVPLPDEAKLQLNPQKRYMIPYPGFSYSGGYMPQAVPQYQAPVQQYTPPASPPRPIQAPYTAPRPAQAPYQNPSCSYCQTCGQCALSQSCNSCPVCQQPSCNPTSPFRKIAQTISRLTPMQLSGVIISPLPKIHHKQAPATKEETEASTPSSAEEASTSGLEESAEVAEESADNSEDSGSNEISSDSSEESTDSSADSGDEEDSNEEKRKEIPVPTEVSGSGAAITDDVNQDSSGDIVISGDVTTSGDSVSSDVSADKELESDSDTSTSA